MRDAHARVRGIERALASVRSSGLPRDAALELDARAGTPLRRRPPRANRATSCLAVARVSKAQIDVRLGAIGHGVLARCPPRRSPTLTVTPRVVVGERLRAIDEARERPDRVRPFFVGVARVRGAAVARSRPMPPVPLRRVMIASALRPASKTSAPAAPAIASRITFCPSGEPTSSSRDDREAHRRDRVEPAGRRERAERVRDDDEPALHVEHAGSAREIVPSRRNPSKVPGGNTVSR